MRRRASFGVAAIGATIAALVCCDAYSPAADAPDGGRPPDGGSDPDVVASSDAAPDPDARPALFGVHSPRCPRPKPPPCNPQICPKRRLYEPPNAAVELPFGIATDSQFVYWTTIGRGDAGDSAYNGRGDARIMRVACDGSPATVIATGQRNATAIAIAGDWVFWGATTGTKSSEIRRARRDCAASCVVEPVFTTAAEYVFGLVEVDEHTLLATSHDGRVVMIAIDDAGNATDTTSTFTSDFPAITATSTEGFATGGLTPVIQRIPVATRAPVPFATLPDASAQGEPAGLSPITTDCSDVFGFRGGSRIWRVAIDGGAASQLALLPTSDAYDVTTDQSWLYVAAPNGTGVFAVELASKSPVTIQSGNVFRIAVDDAGVYWGDHDPNSGGALWMMEK